MKLYVLGEEMVRMDVIDFCLYVWIGDFRNLNFIRMICQGSDKYFILSLNRQQFFVLKIIFFRIFLEG